MEQKTEYSKQKESSSLWSKNKIIKKDPAHLGVKNKISKKGPAHHGEEITTKKRIQLAMERITQ